MRKREFVQRDFAQGEVGFGWHQLRNLEVYYHAAKTLENWWPRADGWLERRPSFVHELSWQNPMFWRSGTKAARVFAHSKGDWIVVVENVSDVYKAYIADADGGMVQAEGGGDVVLTLDVLESELDEIDDGASFAFTTILTHENYTPKVFTYDGGFYNNRELAYETVDGTVGTEEKILLPTTKFAESAATMTLTDISGSEGTSDTYEVTCSEAIFEAGHDVGGGASDHIRIEFRGVQLRIYEHISGTKVKARAVDAISDLSATTDWFEQAWSPVRGWPKTTAYWRGRLWMGGGREIGNRMFLAASVVGQPYSFDVGDGTGDVSIQLTIQEDAIIDEQIQHLVPDGNRLLVFTSAGIWAIEDNGSTDGLTVATVRVRRLVRIDVARIRPIVFNGTAVFVPGNRKALTELRFSRERGTHFMQPLATTIRHRFTGGIKRLVSIPDLPSQGRPLLGVLDADGDIMVSDLALEIPGWFPWTCNGHPLAKDIASNGKSVVALNQIDNYRVMGKLLRGYAVDYSVNASHDGTRDDVTGYTTWIAANSTAGRDETYRIASHSWQHNNEAGIGFRPMVQMLPPSLGQQGAWMTGLVSRLHGFSVALEAMALMPWATIEGRTWEVDHLYTHNWQREDIPDFDEGDLSAGEPTTRTNRYRLPLPPTEGEAEPEETLIFGGEAYMKLLGIERVYTY